jgi:hypothetical protein
MEGARGKNVRDQGKREHQKANSYNIRDQKSWELGAHPL